MAREYRKVADAIEDIRAALGALAGACEPPTVSPYRGIGYAESALQSALSKLVGPENTEDSPAYMSGFTAAAGSIQPPLPFEA